MHVVSAVLTAVCIVACVGLPFAALFFWRP
jgi:hypothetical protein